MGSSSDRVHDKSFFGRVVAFLESIRNRSRFSNSVPNNTDESRREFERSDRISSENFQSRLQNMGEERFSGRVDEEIPENVQKSHNMTNMKKQEQPKTREEEFSECYFEWVKTERMGDVSRFKEFVVENGVEYIVFQDNTRVNSALLGDVILKHRYQDEVMGGLSSEFERVSEPARVQPVPVAAVQKSNSQSPIISILDKAKRKRKKVTFELVMELPSSEILNIVKENFDASDDELFMYFSEKIDKKKFVSAIISSINQ